MKKIFLAIVFLVTLVSTQSTSAYLTEANLVDNFGKTGQAYQKTLFDFVEKNKSDPKKLQAIGEKIETLLKTKKWKNTKQDQTLKAALEYLNELIVYTGYALLGDGTWEVPGKNIGEKFQFTIKNKKLNGDFLVIQDDITLKGCELSDNYMEGICIVYYPETEKIKYISEFQKSRQTGKFVEYYTNGKIFTEAILRNGAYDGKMKQYYENGTLMHDNFFVNGIKSGNQKSYYSNGQLQIELNFKEGQYDGEMSWYSMDGVRLAKLQYENGKKVGLHEGWSYTGKKAIEIPYNESGNIHGVAKVWFENGKILFEDTYEDGVVKTSKGYDETGKKVYDGVWYSTESLQKFMHIYLDLDAFYTGIYN